MDKVDKKFIEWLVLEHKSAEDTMRWFRKMMNHYSSDSMLYRMRALESVIKKFKKMKENEY